MRHITLLVIVLLAFALSASAQRDPESAHVNLYFPHLVDGGNLVQKWQTWFIFINTHKTIDATVNLYLYGNNGSPLALDLGQGASSTMNFTVPHNGRITLRSKIASQTVVAGWAAAYSSIPLQATVLFRMIDGGTAKADFAAPATLPSVLYRSAASRNTGIALANVYPYPIEATVTTISQNGDPVETARVPLAAKGHWSGNLYGLFPGLPDFLGSVEIGTTIQPNVILAWTLNEDGGLISTLPPGRLEWPIAHVDRIYLVFKKALEAARTVYPGVNWDTVTLQVTPKWIGGDQFNAQSNWDGTVNIPESLSELMSDSESELGWIAAHELGHQVQHWSSGFRVYDSNSEIDADKIGLLLSLYAGFDPYAAAGALAKLAMATGQAGLDAQQVADHGVELGTDPHPSYGTRINTLWVSLKALCANPLWTPTCTDIKQWIHPNFPWSTPMIEPRLGSPR